MNGFLHNRRAAMHRQHGFTLIEMMVAIVVGLIVTAAALALVATIMRANTESTTATRLTQEIRAISEVIIRDIRRARYFADPLDNIGKGVPLTTGVAQALDQANNGFSTADPPNVATSCVKYGYETGIDGVSGAGIPTYRAIYLDEDASGAGRVILATGTSPTGVTCSSAGEIISSPQVDIDELAFKVCSGVLEIKLTGRMRAGFFSTAPGGGVFERTIVQALRVRSGSTLDETDCTTPILTS